MPEEINRLLTDAVADLLLVSEPSGIENLRREGVAEAQGAPRRQRDDRHAAEPAAAARASAGRRRGLGLRRAGYGFVTLHRPSNVDDPATLAAWSTCCTSSPRELPLVFPVHPRTQDAAARAGLRRAPGARTASGCVCLGPQPYLDTLSLVRRRRGRAHRLGRPAGGDLGARRAVPDAAREHRAARHGRAGHEPAGRQRRRAHPRGVRRRARRPLAQGPADSLLGRARGRAVAEALADWLTS